MSRPDFEEVFGLNAAYAEKVYGEYLEAPEKVPEEWRQWFDTTLPADQRAVQRPAPVPAATATASEPPSGLQPLTGVAARIVANMEDSLSVPTATSTREVPVKVLEENRHILNRHQLGLILPKVSFTHLIAFAALQAIGKVKAMAGAFVMVDGKPFRKRTESVNFGVAIDLPGK
ncbi:MAG: 2-oxo acid dehydrogenase subunit E2, partial [Planctomycetota bacterium]